MTDTATRTKDLRTMQAEVADVNFEKGWRGDGAPAVTFGESIALLHSEVSEALEAYRDHGLADVTAEPVLGFGLPKPEGVGSELADVLIRLLDTADRFGIDLGGAVEQLPAEPPVCPSSFGDQMALLHLEISLIAPSRIRFDKGEIDPLMFGEVYRLLGEVCSEHGIDLDAEYERKLAFNRTRSHRHGGKRL